jgi:hypothetical protein
MPLTTNIDLNIKGLLTGTNDIGDVVANLARNFGAAWGSGTGAGQADLAWGDVNTLAASATTDIDLAGSLTNPLGGTLTFARVKMILVLAGSGNTNNVVVGGAAATQFIGPFGAATHTVAVKPGGMFMVAAPDATGWAVTAGSTDFLRIANSSGGTGVDYSIMVIGASA